MTDATVSESLRAYVKLLRASKAVVARIEPLLASECLTPTQLGVLEALLHLGPLTQTELGRKVLTSAGNMTDLIDKLAARGLVARTRALDDRRRVNVDLTCAGRALIARVFPGHARDIAGAMGGLCPEDLRLLGDLLRRLGKAAQGEPRPCAAPERVLPDRSTSNE